jgi:hypothetical protein
MNMELFDHPGVIKGRKRTNGIATKVTLLL